MQKKRLGIQNMRDLATDFRASYCNVMQSIDGILKDGRTPRFQVHLVDITNGFEKSGMVRLRRYIDKR